MANKMKCLILSAAEITDYSFLKEIIKKETLFVICADGGYRHAENLKIKPDLVIGDFDSYNGENIDCNEIIRLTPEKDDTDTFFAVKEAFKRSFNDIIIAGGIGSRLDHTFANIQTLLYIKNNGGRGILVNENNKICVLKNETCEILKESKYVSIFSLCPVSYGITLEGMKYPLSNYDLKNDSILGTSNEILKEKGKISVKNGCLLVIFSDD